MCISIYHLAPFFQYFKYLYSILKTMNVNKNTVQRKYRKRHDILLWMYIPDDNTIITALHDDFILFLLYLILLYIFILFYFFIFFTQSPKYGNKWLLPLIELLLLGGNPSVRYTVEYCWIRILFVTEINLNLES